jgi:hypothetical protein
MEIQGKILIVGNASSALEQKYDLSGYNVFIRMNKGFPRGKENYIGSQTDIVATSIILDSQEVEEYDPQFICWMSPRKVDIGLQWQNYCKKTIKFYPLDKWNRIQKMLGANPTTGCMCIDFFTEENEVDILGFDWLETGSWHWRKDGKLRYQSMYNWEGEKEFILKHKNVKRILGGRYAR